MQIQQSDGCMQTSTINAWVNREQLMNTIGYSQLLYRSPLFPITPEEVPGCSGIQAVGVTRTIGGEDEPLYGREVFFENEDNLPYIFPNRNIIEQEMIDDVTPGPNHNDDQHNEHKNLAGTC